MFAACLAAAAPADFLSAKTFTCMDKPFRAVCENQQKKPLEIKQK